MRRKNGYPWRTPDRDTHLYGRLIIICFFCERRMRFLMEGLFLSFHASHCGLRRMRFLMVLFSSSFVFSSHCPANEYGQGMCFFIFIFHSMCERFLRFWFQALTLRLVLRE